MLNDHEHIEPVDDDWQPVDPLLIDAALRTLTAQRARLWSLVLDARYLPCQLQEQGGTWLLLVPAERFAEACHELRCFEQENRHWPPPPPDARPLVENSLATLSVLLLLATFHNVTRLDLLVSNGAPIDWVALGSAQAAQIADGQWWRLVTALTLHSDVVHLLSNLTIGGIFVFLLCRELGSGLAWALLLAAGVSGNALNTFLHSGSHNSVGASTAVFGAVGILAALNLVRQRYHRQRRWALPVAAALALLAILGTEGKQTDLGAHFFGFLSGMIFGLLTERLIAAYGRPGPLLNALLALLSGLIVVTAWLAAVAAG
jgi:membrane associated rhomboid family serine protease